MAAYRSEQAEYIKSRISMQDVCSRYGVAINREGFANCPFHREKTASLKIYKDSFYCFGCGAGGDIISFIMRLKGLNFPQALMRLNCDFGLAYSPEPSPRDREKRRAEELQKLRERQERERIYQEKSREFKEAFYAMHELAPRSGEDFPHPSWVAAVHKINGLRQWLDENLSVKGSD